MGPSDPSYGALVISLDFELHWGVRDKPGILESYGDALAGARPAVGALLELFESFDVHATWATVGFLLARGRDEAQRYAPEARPRYADPALDPYREPMGDDEAADALHFAPSLVDTILATPGQELATHTYSHFYCLEPGQDAEAFDADLSAAVRIAADRGVSTRSIVYPRNQHNPEYDAALVRNGIIAYRGNPRGSGWSAVTAAQQTLRARVARAVDAYVPLYGHHTYAWSDLRRPGLPLCNVPASFFLRLPSQPRLRARALARIRTSMEHAARNGRIVHLWWHPHNFGVDTSARLAALRDVLVWFAELRDRHGMRSLTMAEIATSVLGPPPPASPTGSREWKSST
jgi:peptidoglycan/xylan/chitin deacetylase (PgdA/CDA1 family)